MTDKHVQRQSPEPGRPLTKKDLRSGQAVTSLGLAVAKHLLSYGVCTVFLATDGSIQVARPGEVTLDALPEPMAIQELIGRGYDDAELEEYLKGRDARLGISVGGQ